jgi:hypothetical protein
MGADAVVEAYIRGKDGNRPDVAAQAFASDARLTVRNVTAAVEFPAVTEGRDAIVDVLVTQFGKRYANVRTFCLARPAPEATTFACDWLVGMTGRDDGSVRVGSGRYDWALDAAPTGCASELVITIDAMEVLPPALAPAILSWTMRSLTYPWSSAVEISDTAPAIEQLAPVLARLRRDAGK